MRLKLWLILIAFVPSAIAIGSFALATEGNPLPDGVPNGVGNPVQTGIPPGVSSNLNQLPPQVQNALMLRALRGYRGGNRGPRTGMPNPIMDGNFGGGMDPQMGMMADEEPADPKRLSSAEKRAQIKARQEEKKQAAKQAAEQKKAKRKAAQEAKAAKLAK